MFRRVFSSFRELKLHPKTLECMETEFKYSNTTPVQEAVLKGLGSDLLVRAKTGTGKTLAFLIAALEHAKFHSNAIPVLVVSPTRELANQIAEEGRRLAAYHRLNVRLAVGGTPRTKLMWELQRRTDILVGTPGRLADILKEKHIAAQTSKLQVLVLDECDQLLDMGFKKELNEIVARLPQDRQTLMFSATISPPIQQAARTMLSPNVKYIDAVPATESDTHLQIKQSYIVARYQDQFSLLDQILGKHRESVECPKIIVFFQTTKMVQLMTLIFERLGYSVMQLHSKMDQPSRSKVSGRFRKARDAILFTSDVSARGVDYPDVSLVVSFGMPPTRESYIHRIGRTGRAGKSGESILILSNYEKDFMKTLGKLPVRQEMRYAPNSGESAGNKRIIAALLNIPREHLEEVVVATLGFHFSKREQSGMSKHSLALALREMALKMMQLPALPRFPPKLLHGFNLAEYLK